jgi:hypothetical protein
MDGRLRDAFVTADGHRLRFWVPAALFVVVRSLSLLITGIVGSQGGRSLFEYLTSLDAIWYHDIAVAGYDDGPGTSIGVGQESNLAFFPLYPMLIRFVGQVTGFWAAELVVAWACAVGAAVVLYCIAARILPSDVALLTVLLWACAPKSMVFQMGYTESALAVLSFGALLALLDRQFVWAALLACAAGVTRPTGLAIVGVVMLWGLLSLICGQATTDRVPKWQCWVAMVVPPLGFLGYLTFVGWRIGNPLGWFQIQSVGWGNDAHFGVGVVKLFTGFFNAHPFQKAASVEIVVAIGLLIWIVVAKYPAALTLWCAFLLVITVSGSYRWAASWDRFMLPAFALLLPVSALVSRWPRWLVAALCVVVFAGNVVFSCFMVGYASDAP